MRTKAIFVPDDIPARKSGRDSELRPEFLAGMRQGTTSKSTSRNGNNRLAKSMITGSTLNKHPMAYDYTSSDV
jgi:hypothetical protein